VERVRAPRRRRNSNFDLAAKRRREIELHARYVGAAQTDNFDRWLIAWVWHNCKAKEQVWSVMECAKNMGRKITEAEASAITEEASITRKHLSADNLARFLGVTYAQRQALRLTTIGSVNVRKRARKELRKRRDRMAKQRKRRASGVLSRAEYEANSTAAASARKHLKKRRSRNIRMSLLMRVLPAITTSEAPEARSRASVPESLMWVDLWVQPRKKQIPQQCQ
jgi:hypothetical protein